jgi:cobalt/nickel transport system permease protein
MHVPDGFLDAPTSLATGAAAAVAVGVALAGARRELDDRTAPMAGLVAAFIFAAQMLNFPVASGTSGHLLGGALAAVLVGPWTALLCMSVVFLVQCLLFADGGITALGTNIVLMGVTTVAVGWVVFRLLQAVLPKRLSLLPLEAGIAALLSVPASALVFVGLYSLGGTAPLPLDDLTAAMVSVHLLIGIGEGVITFLAVASIVAVRPDLVYGARRVLTLRTLEVRPATTGATTGATS